ncbi:MAG: ABC transporter permease [Methanomicrobiaceae archaeon]|nr:ABC transporter permease [Methanomicrobiaceae archaeon]
MTLRHVALIARKELRGLARERTIVFAVLLQLFIAMFSSFLMVGLATLYDPDAVAGFSSTRYAVGYAGSDSALRELLEAGRDFRVYPMDLSTAVAALKERTLNAVIWVPATPPDAAEPVTITLYTVQNDIQASVVTVKIKGVLVDYEQELRAVRADRLTEQPVAVAVPASAGGENFYEFVFGLLIPLLVFMPAIISAALIIDLICEEYQHGTLETLMATPVTFGAMLWGKVAACLALVPVQAGAWLLLLAANGIAVENAVPILLHVTAGSLALILIGALCALHYRERTAAQFIFSTGIVVVVLVVLALPANPLNLIVLLAIGAIGAEHWLILAATAGGAALLACLTGRYADRVGGMRRDRILQEQR